MKDNNDDLLKMIKSKYNRLSKGQRIIAEYIIKHYDKAAFMTASKLGDEVGVSESTVVRFAGVLGFSGYPELQKALQELVKIKLTTVQRLSMQQDLTNQNTIIEKILRADINNIRYTLNEINNQEFEKVVECICSAKNIYIIGLRSSYALAEYLGFYLNLILNNVKIIGKGISDIYEELLRIDEEDLVIAISYPRYSRKTIEVLDFIKKQNCKVIGITDSLSSPIADMSDNTLIAKSSILSFVDSLVAPLSLINAIIIAIGMTKKDEITEYFKKLENIWEEYNIYDNIEKTDLNDFWE